MTKFCIASDRVCAPNDSTCQAQGIEVKGFVLRPEAKNSELCQNMIRPELAYTKKGT